MEVGIEINTVAVNELVIDSTVASQYAHICTVVPYPDMGHMLDTFFPGLIRMDTDALLST